LKEVGIKEIEYTEWMNAWILRLCK
jgi:hypothetical protein